MILILPIQECGTFFCFFESSLSVLSEVVEFSAWKSFTSLVRLTAVALCFEVTLFRVHMYLPSLCMLLGLIL